MRTIKFRVWIYDKQVEDGYLNDVYYQFHRDNEGYYVYENWRDAEDGISRRCIPMQFTGLHDKNGKEVFEGDIFELGVVEWIDGAFRFKNSNCYMVIDSHIAHNFEIIGNIFENAELVKL